MTTMVSGMQQLLETLASTPLIEDDVRQGDATTFAAALIERRSSGWDPHEVWLHRIKEPRDQQNNNR